MLIRFFIFAFFSTFLFAEAQLLDATYYVENRKIDSSIVLKDGNNFFTIALIDENKSQKRVKTKELLTLLAKNGYKNFTSKSAYTTFILKSPIDTSFIEDKLIEYFKKEYVSIEIDSIFVTPRSYMSSLPKEYSVDIDEQSYLSKEGTISIKTPQNKKFFFDYEIKANLLVYESKDIIQKGTKVSFANCVKKSILIDKFRDKPLDDIEKKAYQASRQIQKGSVLTQRDVEALKIVRRNAALSVTYYKDGMGIVFSAKALQDAKLNDIIKVQNSNKKILKVRVTGENMAELE